MVYMSLSEETDTRLRLVREPTFLSKAVFIGFLVGVIGIVIFGSESWLLKSVIGLVTVGLSFFMLDNYEVCEFDKEKGEVQLIRLHWFAYLFGQVFTLGEQSYVVVKLEDIKAAKVEEQAGEAGPKAYQVALSLHSGVHLGITEVFSTDPVQEHEMIAKNIDNFLKNTSGSAGDWIVKNEALGDDVQTSGDDDDDDDFEQITKEDVEEAGVDDPEHSSLG